MIKFLQTASGPILTIIGVAVAIAAAYIGWLQLVEARKSKPEKRAEITPGPHKRDPLTLKERRLAQALKSARLSYSRNRRVVSPWKKILSEYGREVINAAAENGSVDALVMLTITSMSNYNDDGEDHDVDGLTYIMKAVELGDPQAKAILSSAYDGRTLELDHDKGRALLEDAVRSGHVEALLELGNAIQRGEHGFEPDDKKIREAYEAARKKGSFPATFALGKHLLRDKTDESNKQAKLVIDEAANGGLIEAEYWRLTDKIKTTRNPGQWPMYLMEPTEEQIKLLKELARDPDLDRSQREKLSRWA